MAGGVARQGDAAHPGDHLLFADRVPAIAIDLAQPRSIAVDLRRDAKRVRGRLAPEPVPHFLVHRQEHLGARKDRIAFIVQHPAGVVGMKMGQGDPVDVGRGDAQDRKFATTLPSVGPISARAPVSIRVRLPRCSTR